MAAVDFPASPSVGQIFSPGGGLPQYVWTGAVWNSYGTSQPKTWMSLSTVPPSNPVDGDFWWQTDTGLLFVRYNDGSSVQWVVATPAMDLAALDTRYLQASQMGCFKISSGVLASAVATVDIALPTGYHTLELLVSNYNHSIDLQNPLLRFSLDGTTFLASANYSWSYNSVGQAGTNAPAGGGGANHIFIGPVFTNAGANRANFRLTMPMSDGTNCQYVIIDTVYSTGGGFGRSAGGGFLSSTVGAPLALRLIPGSGNINAGTRWQLNGYK